MRLFIQMGGVNDSVRYRKSEWLLSVVMFGWGAILLQDYPTFALPTFAGLQQMGISEDFWGRVCLALGLCRLGVLVVNGRWRKCSHARAACAFVYCFIWATVTWGLIKSGTVNTGLVVYFAFLIADLHTIFAASSDAKGADEIHRHGAR